MSILPDPHALWSAHKVLNDELSWIELQDMMPHPLTGIKPYEAIVQAARVSRLGDSKGEIADLKLISFLRRNRHTSPFEQVELKFRLSAPVVVWWQLVRHRTFSLNLQSGRYVVFDEDGFYDVSNWRRNDDNNRQVANALIPEESSQKWRDALRDHTQNGYRLYQEALNDGVAKEQARFFLPAWASYYLGIVKMDLHNLFHFIGLRATPEAQWEIRQYALAMESCLLQIDPQLMATLRE